MATLFLDTNSLLHYRRFDEIAWHSLIEGEGVTLVIEATVLSELDRHKSEHRLKRLRRRAGNLLRFIEELAGGELEGVPVRDGVVLDFQPLEPSFDFGSSPLDPSIADDRLLAAVLLRQSDPSETDVRVVTNDTGLTLKARSLGVKTLRLAEELRLTEERDEHEAEVARLQGELLRLQAAQPLVQLTFDDEKTELVFQQTVPPGLSEAAGHEFLERARREYRPMAMPPIDATNARAYLLDPLSETFINAYNSELDGYFTALERYVADVRQYGRNLSERIEIRLLLSNKGTATATDVDLRVIVSAPYELLDFDNAGIKPERPRPPTPPEQRRHLMERDVLMMGGMLRGGLDAKTAHEPPNVTGPEASADYRELNFRVRKLQHHRPIALGSVYLDITINPRLANEGGRIPIRYEMAVGNCPDPIEEVLIIRVTPSAG